MEKLNKLYTSLDKCGVTVVERSIPFTDALVVEVDGKMGLFLDRSQWQTSSEETVSVAHECGHIFTGSLHTLENRLKLVSQHENRADKWAVKKLIPLDELDDAVANGCTEIWELAELFGVTEQFMRKALCYYVHGNLATELYF